MTHTVALAAAIYPVTVLEQCAAEYQSFCVVAVEGEEAGNLRVSITPEPDCGHLPEVLTSEFLNFVLDCSIRSHFSGSVA